MNKTIKIPIVMPINCMFLTKYFKSFASTSAYTHPLLDASQLDSPMSPSIAAHLLLRGGGQLS